MKKVLIAIDRFPPDYSGAALRALRMCERINKKYGQIFDILCVNRYNVVDKAKPGINVKRMNLVNEEGILFPIYLLQSLIKTNLYLLKNKRKIDVIHFFSFSWMNRMIMLSNILFYKKRTLLEITLDGDDDPISLLSKGKKNRILKSLTRHLLNRIDKFIVLSEHGCKSCLSTGISEKKIWFRPNPVDASIFGRVSFEQKNTMRKRLGLPNKFILLNVGIVQPRKNQLFLCKCVNLLRDKDVLLLLIGPIQEEFRPYYEKVKAYISKNNLSSQVLFLEEKNNVNEYMIAADLAVFASKSEGFPNFIAESLMSGLPIVTLSLEVLEKYVNNNTGILIQAKNESDGQKKFVNSIKMIHEKKIKFNRNSIRLTARKTFSDSIIDSQYTNLYGLARKK
jgi:glycosyltransferase involved in cell wall biosynthesis